MAYPPAPEQNTPGTPTLSAAKVFESLAKSVQGSFAGRSNRERIRETVDRDFEMVGSVIISSFSLFYPMHALVIILKKNYHLARLVALYFALFSAPELLI
jgi:hypothetical protein